jgi:Domain of unknown function (DUF4190)
VERPTDGMAIAALVVGLPSLTGVVTTGYPGVILGLVAVVLAWGSRARIKRSGPTPRGGWLALAGGILGACGILLGTAVVLWLTWLTGALQF